MNYISAFYLHMVIVPWKTYLIYLDEVMGKNVEEPLSTWREGFIGLRNAYLQMNAEKCVLF